MANFVEFDMEEIRQFGRHIEDFTCDMDEIMKKMNGALANVQEFWQDGQLEKPTEDIIEANANIMRTVNDLYPLVADFLRRQEQWYDEYVSI